MSAPLSQYLTRFSTSPGEALPPPPAAVEPMVVLTPADLAARIEAATEAGRAELRAGHAAEIVAREAAAADALAQARADWASSQAEILHDQITTGFETLQIQLADRIAAVLRPFLAEAMVTRTLNELREALDRLLADDSAQVIRISGPADLIAALRAGGSAPGIEWVTDDAVGVAIVADATRIETRLGAALRALDITER